MIGRVKHTRKLAAANPKQSYPAPANPHAALERLVRLLARGAARHYATAVPSTKARGDRP